MRFIKCLRNKYMSRSVPLSSVETAEGVHALCRDVQYTVFPDEIRQLSESQALNPRSILLSFVGYGTIRDRVRAAGHATGSASDGCSVATSWLGGVEQFTHMAANVA